MALSQLKLMTAFLTTFSEYSNISITPEKLANGIIFVKVLSTIEQFNAHGEEFNFNAIQWGDRLKNLKKLLKCIQIFLENEEKGVNFSDIDLIEISKRFSISEQAKMFELLILCFMQSSLKEECVQRIMGLAPEFQQSFVDIIQNSMGKRISSLEEAKQNRTIHALNLSQLENNQIKEEINDLIRENYELTAKIANLENQVEQLEKLKSKGNGEDWQLKIDQQSHLVEYFKQKIISLSRDHQNEINELTRELTQLRNQNKQNDTMEEMILFYRQKYEQAVAYIDKMSSVDKDKQKELLIIQQKDFLITNLQDKIEQLTHKIVEIEERQLDLTISNEKYKAKMKELEKQMKNKLNFSIPQQIILADTINTIKQNDQREQNQKQDNRVKLLLEKKNRDLARQNAKLIKKIDGLKVVEQEKRRLEAIIIEMGHRENEQLQILVSSLFQVYHLSKTK